MANELEPKDVRKQVGRFPAQSNPLRRLQQLNAFVFKFSKNELPSGELFPVRKLLVGLVQAEVDFAIVGGLAVSLNGYIRTTEVADMIFAPHFVISKPKVFEFQF